MTLDVKLRDMEKHEMLIQFWRIPQGLNEADVYAKAGAVSTVLYLKFLHTLRLSSGKGPCRRRNLLNYSTRNPRMQSALGVSGNNKYLCRCSRRFFCPSTEVHYR